MYSMWDPVDKIQDYMKQKEIAGAGLIVTQNGKEIVRTFQGYADIDNHIPITEQTVFRLASMSKPVTAVAIMQLWEQGKLYLDDPVDKYLPEFADMQVPSGLVFGEITFGIAERRFTIKDVLTHSAGLGMGTISAPFLEKCSDLRDTLADRVRKYSEVPLDFEPGTMTGYSALVGFDLLGRLVEVVSGKTFEDYIRSYIVTPLGIQTLGFDLEPGQEGLPVLYYKAKDGTLKYDADMEKWWIDANHYHSGAAGMIGTLDGYNRFVQMLAGKGTLDGVQILKPETVELMITARAGHGKELEPGCEWGLGMLYFSVYEKTSRFVGEHTFGWSGAFGTHFYIDPTNKMTVCLAVQRADIGGAMSHVSHGLEEAIYRTFILNNE